MLANAATVYASGEYDLESSYSTISGYTIALNGIKLTGGVSHDYGWVMKNGGSFEVLVSGSCTVKITGSKYSAGNVTASASAGTITPASQSCVVENDKVDTYDFVYEGGEATLTFGCADSNTQAYTPKITVVYD